MYHSSMGISDRQHTPRLADELLADILRNTETTRLANTVWVTWPLAKSVTTAVAWLLTDRVLHPSGYSLLSLCVVKAFRRYQQQLQHLGDPNNAQLQVAYLAGLFEALPALIELRASDGVHDWDPLHGPPLGEWLAQHPRATLELVEPEGEAADRNPVSLRLHWLGQLVSAEALAALGPHLRTISGDNELR